MKKIISYLCLLLFTLNCAGFKNIELPESVIENNNIENINGIYENFASSGNGFYVRMLTDVFDRNTNMFNWKDKYDPKNTRVKLQMIEKNKLNVIFFKNEKIVFNKNLRVELKEDGYLYLKEKRFMLDGIPLVLGGWNIQKSRLGVDENNNLRIQSNYFYCNGFAVLMSDWKTLHYNLTFEKQ
ncbi:hypothetical protein [Chryseobacterium sp. SL1]|uniref:hypothetical protein n=1 Tax=Chryseobacterium sp. SL1 TaxID=2995159 RepID=UPI00227590D8|nr:hypothetical protein [Chryseobacterium sp. SL1]MCY1663049.1 hypothetical protein [Chryseobacterium sp. SL1]